MLTVPSFSASYINHSFLPSWIWETEESFSLSKVHPPFLPLSLTLGWVITPSLQAHWSLFHSTHSFFAGKGNSSFTFSKKINKQTFPYSFLSLKLITSLCHLHSQTLQRRESSLIIQAPPPASPQPIPLTHIHQFHPGSAAIKLLLVPSSTHWNLSRQNY